MEAIGKKDENGNDYTVAQQVQQRPARTWFNRSIVERVTIRWDDRASWTQRQSAATLAVAQDPDPYKLFTHKTDSGVWYCSKLVWYVYRRATGRSLDPTWGFWVKPEDLYRSGNLRTVYDYTRTS